MSNSNRKEQYVWLAAGVLLVAWVIAASTNFGFHNAWETAPTIGQAFTQNFAILAGAALVTFGVLIAWLFYSLGNQELRKQAEMERTYRHVLEEAYRGTLQALTSALDLRDDETYGHSRRVMGYSLAIGRRLQLGPAEIQTLAWGSLLHDLGKIGIRDGILLKNGPLTREEAAEMRQHVIIGYQMVLNVPFLARTASLIRHHHERFDGTGYPDLMQGADIPLLARIFAVADAFDAMTSPRPYRPVPRTMEAALQVIEECAGTQFCPDVAKVFRQILVADLQKIRSESFMPIEHLVELVHVGEEFSSPTPSYYQDPLTKTQNRAGWAAKTAQMSLRRGKEIGALAFLDVDGLKAVNSQHGQLTGDRLLADLGTRLLSFTPDVYRLGGDEFVIWFDSSKWGTELNRTLFDLLDRFSEYWHQLLPSINVSCGVSVATEQTESMESLIVEADRTMNLTKARARAEAEGAPSSS